MHPYFDDPTRHYDWADWGTSVLIQVANDSRKARNSIRMFGLASLEMNEHRAAVKLLNERKSQKPISNEDEDVIKRSLEYKLTS